MALLLLLGCLVCPAAAAASMVPPFPTHLVGNVSAVSALLERVVPGASAHFEFEIAAAAAVGSKNAFTISDTRDGRRIRITGTTASELTGGLGVYLREHCGMTIGWARGGGTRVFTPKPWPKIGAQPVSRARSVPYSHVTQVCTHSYTLVWHGWAEWERFIDCAY